MNSKSRRTALGIFSVILLGIVSLYAQAPPNPVPLINQPLVPTSTVPGGAGFTLTVNGTGFVSGATVNFNGSPRTTTFVSSSQLTAAILASDIAADATALVTVVNPAPGGGQSNVAFFPITNPTTSVAFSRTDFATGTVPAWLITDDFNGDGKLDLAVSNELSNSVSVLLGNGDGTFQTQATFATGVLPEGITTGDFNGDGKLDLAVANHTSGTVSVLLGNGDGTFQPRADFTTGSGPGGMTTGDFNGDGKLDLAVANFTSTTVSVLLGNGDGTFQPRVDFAAGAGAASVTAGDFNGDGKLELAVANFTSTTVSVLLGNGNGTFQAKVDFGTGTSPHTVIAGDFNGDGKLDLAVTNADSNTVSILLGNGDGTFQPRLDFATSLAPKLVTTGDFNGDGKLDLGVANQTSGKVSVLLGNGDGTFQAPVDFATDSNTFGVTAGDFNGDGRLDLAATNAFSTTVSVLLQTPLVTLTPATLTFAGQIVGTTSAAQVVTLTNRGGFSLGITSIAASGDFAQTNTCGASVAAGANCTISVTFTPTATGTRTGSITITDNAAGSPHTVSLTGTGISAAIVSFSVPSLSFGDQVVGTTSPPQTVTLTNTGTGPLGILGITTTGNFGQTNDCPPSLAVGAFCNINMTFAPTVVGTIVGSVTITHDAAGSPNVVTLIGNGINISNAPHAAVKIWDIQPLIGFDPNESVEDIFGLTQHVASVDSPLTVATVMENTTHPGGPCGLLFWNPGTNQFKWYGFGFGFQAGIDLNRTAPIRTDTATGKTFQPGDIWSTNDSCPGLLVNFKGSDNFRAYKNEFGSFLLAWGVQVDQKTGNVWVTEKFSELITRIDPATNLVRRISVGGEAGYIALDSAGRAYTAKSAGFVGVDEIVRVDADTGEVVRWSVPSGGFTSGSPFSTPNGISIDGSGNIWFAESTSGELGRLSPGTDGAFGTADDQVCEFTKAGLLDPQLIANTGSGSASQVYFTEGAGNAASVLTEVEAAGKCTTVPASLVTLPAETPTYTTVDFTEQDTATGCPCQTCRSPLTATITPTLHDIVGLDGGCATGPGGKCPGTTLTSTGEVIPGILRFPFSSASPPASVTQPSGMTGVAVADTIFGSDIGNDKVFEVRTGAIVPPPPVVVLSATSLTFADQLVGTTSAPQTVTLTNGSTATLNITSIAATGDFAQTNNCGTSVAAGANCAISVTFGPTSLGARTGSISIFFDVFPNFQQIALSGIGVAPVVTLSPAILSFGNQAVGSTSAAQSVTLTNGSTATAALTITGIVATGDFAQTNTCGGSLAAGASCTIAVTFTPTAAKTSVGAVVITDNALESPHSVTLVGTGGSPSATFCPASVLAANQFVGAGSARQTAALAKPDQATQARVVEAYGKLPLSFEANRRQTGAQVKFLSRGKGYTLALTPTEAVLAVATPAGLQGPDILAWAAGSSHPLLGSAGLTRFLNPKAGESSGKAEEPALQNHDGTLTSAVPQPSTEYAGSPVLRMRLVGANLQAKIRGLGELAAKTNYLLANDAKNWRTGVPNYAGVMYENIYPGVSLMFYGNQGQLEYDFIVAPGADPKAIRLSLVGEGSALPNEQKTGAQRAPLQIDTNGDLIIETEAGDVRLHKPIVYQEVAGRKQAVRAEYAMKGQHEVAFEIAAYDPGKPLVIDPVLSYSTFLGGLLPDIAFRIAVDSACNAYVTGVSSSPDFPITAGAAQPSLVTGSLCSIDSGRSFPCPDVFVTKLNADGTGLVYSTFLGGSRGDIPLSLAVDASGNAYVTGSTSSADFPTTPGAFRTVLAGRPGDAFVTKLNPTGSGLVYSTFLGGSRDDVGTGIAVDSAGNAYVTGSTSSADIPTTTGVIQPAIAAGTCGSPDHPFTCPDVFVTKLNDTGSALVYSTYLGGSSIDISVGIAADSTGNAYVTGGTISTNFPTASPFQATLAGGICGPSRSEHPCADAFVSKLNPAASAFVYSTYLGGSRDDIAFGVAVDSSGSPYVAGVTNSADFPTTPAAVQPAFGGGACGIISRTFDCPDAFVTKLSATGTVLAYSTYLGGSNYDLGFGIAVDPSGSAYVVGATGSSNFPTANALRNTFVGGTCSFRQTIQGSSTLVTFPCPDAFVTKLDGAGAALLHSTYLGGSSYDIAFGAATDAAGSAYVTGGTLSDNFPTANALQPAFAGLGDAFVAKISTPAVILPTTSLSFGNQLIGTTSAPQTVTLANNGSATLTIFSIAVGGDFAQSNTCGSSVAAGANCAISVTFQPTATGARPGTITITDDASGSPHVVNLSGTGTDPAVSLSPTSANFPGNPLNLDCPSRDVTLTNTGTGPLTITSIVASEEFSQTNNCVGSVAVGATCTIGIKFLPTQVRIMPGTITIASNAPGSPHSIALTGNGTPACTLITSAQKAFVVRGTDSTSFTISDPSPSCSPVQIDLACLRNGPATCQFSPASIPPSGRSTLSLGNLSALTGDFLDFLVTASSEFRTASASLTVVVRDFAFATYPPSASVRAGESTSYALAIRPINGLQGKVSLKCSGAPRGASCSVTPATLTLDGLNLAHATVTVKTTARSIVGPGAGPQMAPRLNRPVGLPWVLLLLAGVLMATLAALGRRRACLSMGLVILFAVMWSACGGGGYDPIASGGGTPAGTNALTITGTYTAASDGTGSEAARALTHSTTVTLTVN